MLTSKFDVYLCGFFNITQKNEVFNYSEVKALPFKLNLSVRNPDVFL